MPIHDSNLISGMKWQKNLEKKKSNRIQTTYIPLLLPLQIGRASRSNSLLDVVPAWFQVHDQNDELVFSFFFVIFFTTVLSLRKGLICAGRKNLVFWLTFCCCCFDLMNLMMNLELIIKFCLKFCPLSPLKKSNYLLYFLLSLGDLQALIC